MAECPTPSIEKMLRDLHEWKGDVETIKKRINALEKELQELEKSQLEKPIILHLRDPTK